MAAPTMDELKALRAEVNALNDQREMAQNQSNLSVDKAVAYDIAHQRWWEKSLEYTRKLNAYIEAGKVEGVRP